MSGEAPKDAGDGAVVTLSTDDLSHIVAEFVAKSSGVALPVQREIKWLWAMGQGPVCRVTVKTVANVASLDARRKGKKL